jgi:hypothetical protein
VEIKLRIEKRKEKILFYCGKPGFIHARGGTCPYVHQKISIKAPATNCSNSSKLFWFPAM